MKVRQKRYYNDFTDDFEQSANQNYTLPKFYKWVRTDAVSKFLSAAVYALAIVFSLFYCRLFLHMRVKNRKKLKGIKLGCFIYGNHTQPIGDVFIPALCVFPKRIYTIVSTANYGIPFIGKILPYLGALPIAESLSGLKELNCAIDYRLSKNHPIVIYPEAHVWKYYTDIRPFPDTSFKFPVKFKKPCFAMTVTYRKSKVFKRPLTEVFIDGPFFAEGESAKEKAANLCGKVYMVMKERSKNSNCQYIEYIPKQQNLQKQK